MLQRFAVVLMCLITIGTLPAQTIDNTLPKGAKFKTIPFKKYNYAIQGYVANKAFVEEQKIVILSPIPAKNIHSDTLLVGKYLIQNDTAYIATPAAKIKLQDLTGISDCIYKISNHTDGMSLTANPSIAKPLTMGLYDLNSFKSKTVYIEKDTSNRYQCKIHYPSILRQLSITFDSLSCIYNMDYYIKHCSSVTLHYLSSKDTFTGYVYKKVHYGKNTYEADSGEYHFSTGEIFYGRIPKENKLIYFDKKIFVPTDGTTQFSDGATVQGDWLKNYNFNPTEWKYINKHASNLTEIRDCAIEIQQLKKKYASFTEKEWNALYSHDHSIAELQELANAIQKNEKKYAFIGHQWDMMYQHCSSVKEMQTWIDKIIEIQEDRHYSCWTYQFEILKAHCKTLSELEKWDHDIRVIQERCYFNLGQGEWSILSQHRSNYDEFTEYAQGICDFYQNFFGEDGDFFPHDEEWMALAHLPIKDIIEQAKEITAKNKKAYKKLAMIRKYGEYYGNLINQRQLEIGMSKEMVNEIYSKDLFKISYDRIYEYWAAKSSISSVVYWAEMLGESFDFPSFLKFENNKLTAIYHEHLPSPMY